MARSAGGDRRFRGIRKVGRTPFFCGLVIIFSFLSRPTQIGAQSPFAGEVVLLQGSAWRMAGADGWQALQTGDPFQGGDEIRTAPESRLHGRIPGVVQFLLYPDSHAVVLADTRRHNHSVEIVLRNGAVRADYFRKNTKMPGRFNVITPTVVAAVRGTRFVVTRATDADRVVCLSGKVQVYIDGGNFLIKPGEVFTLPNGQPAGDASKTKPNIRPLQPGEKQHFRNGVIPGNWRSAAPKDETEKSAEANTSEYPTTKEKPAGTSETTIGKTTASQKTDTGAAAKSPQKNANIKKQKEINGAPAAKKNQEVEGNDIGDSSVEPAASPAGGENEPEKIAPKPPATGKPDTVDGEKDAETPGGKIQEIEVE